MKKRYLFLIIIIFLFTISTVSAEDNLTSDIISMDEEANSLKVNILENNIDSSVNDTDTLKVSNDEILTSANNWYVNGSVVSTGNGSINNPYKTLKEAINSASDGNVIYIASGIYNGSNNVNLDINKELNLVKWGDENPIFDAEYNSRIFTITVNSFNITDLTFKNGKCVSYGAAICFKNNISNSNVKGYFVNNSAEINFGGAIFFMGSVSNSNIAGSYVNNAAFWGGGAIVFGDIVSNSSIMGSFIKNNAAKSLGGAILFISAVFNSTIGGSFIDNVADSGGAILFMGTVYNSNIDGYFVNNTADDYGGAIDFSGGFYNSKINGYFINNTATFSGGAIYFDEGISNCNIGGCFVNNNAHFNYGGAIYFDDDVSYCNVSGCFVNNTVGSVGGAIIFINSVSNCNVSGCFVNNAANKGGGAIYFVRDISYSNVGDCFVNNTAYHDDGAAIYFEGDISYCNVSGCFVNNSANNHLSTIYSKFSSSSITINDNWWGSNNPNWTSLIYGLDIPSSFAVLNVTATPQSIAPGVKSKLIYTFFKNGTYDIISNLPIRAINLSSDGGNLKNTSGYLIKGTFTTEFTSDNTNVYNITGIVDNQKITIKVNVNSNKSNVTMNRNANNITEGENIIIHIILSNNNTTGNVTTTVGGKKYTADIKSGYANITISDLTVGNYSFNIIYSGDDNYNGVNGTINITVNPKENATVVIAPNVTKYFGGSERFFVNVMDNKGNPLVNKTVNITINSITYIRVTDENGTTNIPLGLNSGQYEVIAEVDNITVNSLAIILSTVDGSDVVKIYKNATQYYVTLLDCQGKYLAEGTSVQFNINGVLYNRIVSGERGQVKLNINLPQGKYIITTINSITGEMCANNITVLPNIVDNKEIIKYFKNKTQYSVKVLGADGKVVGVGEEVTFNINGIFYTRQTDVSGIATLNINLPPSNYIITADYKGCKVANNITVLPVLNATDLKMKYKDKKPFKVNLVNNQGKPYAKQVVTFNINGVLYYGITDSTGQAILNFYLPSGEYIITSTYNGSNIANKITITP